MKPVYTIAILDKNLSCPNCQWEGKGRELIQEKFSHEESIELSCPKCNYYFGFINTGTQEDSSS
ncbi:MAG: hypothetical protein H0V30_14185 [Chitinophagaceae bacterium]|jgi:Zn finger protein HypA/HybF involved in hydrogenase expression|nr:hypothetical protein [Chitinophagaceae bacterium]